MGRKGSGTQALICPGGTDNIQRKCAGPIRVELKRSSVEQGPVLFSGWQVDMQMRVTGPGHQAQVMVSGPRRKAESGRWVVSLRFHREVEQLGTHRLCGTPRGQEQGQDSSVLVEPALRNDIGILLDSSSQDTQVSNDFCLHTHTLLCPWSAHG